MVADYGVSVVPSTLDAFATNVVGTVTTDESNRMYYYQDKVCLKSGECVHVWRACVCAYAYVLCLCSFSHQSLPFTQRHCQKNGASRPWTWSRTWWSLSSTRLGKRKKSHTHTHTHTPKHITSTNRWGCVFVEKAHELSPTESVFSVLYQ